MHDSEHRHPFFGEEKIRYFPVCEPGSLLDGDFGNLEISLEIEKGIVVLKIDPGVLPENPFHSMGKESFDRFTSGSEIQYDQAGSKDSTPPYGMWCPRVDEVEDESSSRCYDTSLLQDDEDQDDLPPHRVVDQLFYILGRETRAAERRSSRKPCHVG